MRAARAGARGDRGSRPTCDPRRTVGWRRSRTGRGRPTGSASREALGKPDEIAQIALNLVALAKAAISSAAMNASATASRRRRPRAPTAAACSRRRARPTRSAPRAIGSSSAAGLPSRDGDRASAGPRRRPALACRRRMPHWSARPPRRPAATDRRAARRGRSRRSPAARRCAGSARTAACSRRASRRSPAGAAAGADRSDAWSAPAPRSTLRERPEPA